MGRTYGEKNRRFEGTKTMDEGNQSWTAMKSERGRKGEGRNRGRDCSTRTQGARLAHVNRNIISNCRLPAPCPPPDGPVPRMMHELCLWLVRRGLFRICVHDACEPCRQCWSIRTLSRRIRSLHRGVRIHELELLVSLHRRGV